MAFNAQDLIKKYKGLLSGVQSFAQQHPVLSQSPIAVANQQFQKRVAQPIAKATPTWQAPGLKTINTAISKLPQPIQQPLRTAAPGLQIPEMATEMVNRYGRLLSGQGKLSDLGYTALDVMPFVGGGVKQVARPLLSPTGKKALSVASKGVKKAIGGVGEGISSPKGNYKAQVKEAVERISKPELEKQLQSVSAIRTKAIEEVSSAPIITDKGKLNINRLNVEDKSVLKDIESGVKPTIIGNKEVIDMARTAKGTGTLTDEQMKKMLANQLKNRQQVVDLTAKFNKAKAEGASEVDLGKIMIELADQSTTARQGGTFAGRILQAQNIIADQSATPIQKILALLDNAGISKEKYLKDSIKVNWDNPSEVISFYRKYVPPKFGELLTEFRYSNMLSSPLTHIVNIASNALQTGVVAPVEKTITGVLDWGKSTLTGSQRKYYASAGIDYAGGYVRSLPQAFKKAMNVLSGKEISIRPDYEHIPTGTKGLAKAYTTPLRALEAMDQFYKTLVEGGVTAELKKGPIKVTPTQIASKAAQEGNYRLFRQAFDPNGELGQGVVLRTFDKWNSAINHLRKLPGGNWILPFMQTPTNILKQGVEFSPLGVTTMLGAKNPTEQLSKAIIGTGVFMGAYQLAKNGLVSWEAPSGEKERELYYAAGQQPYSVKIGDKWVSFSKLGPLSYPFAMAAALRNAEKYNPDKSTIENISKSITGMLGFFGDQSYVRSIGDFVDAIQGGVNIGASAMSSMGANLLGQLIPWKSFQTWLGRTIDPVYRKASTFGEKLVKDLPILGSQLEPYTDNSGQPSKRDLPVLNAVSPYKVTQEKNTQLLDEYQTKKIQKGVEKRADESFLSGNKETQTTGNAYRYIDDNGNVKKIPLEWTAPTIKLTGNTELDKKIISKYKGELTTRANEIVKLYEEGQITSDKAEKMLQELKSKSSVVTGKKGKKPSFSIKSIKFPKLKLVKVKKIKVPKMKKVKQYTLKTKKVKKTARLS